MNDVPRWEQRFRAARTTLPGWALDAPDRCLYLSNVSGTVELYTWDRTSDRHRQVTDRPAGTMLGALDRGGESIWWFADTDGDEWGGWRRQPFTDGPDTDAAPGLAASYPAGLDVGTGVAVIGRSTDEGSSVHLLQLDRPDAEPVTVYAHREDATVVGLSRDEDLLCVSHSEHGDSTKPALRVLRVDDSSTAGELWDGPGRGLYGVGFAPVPGDGRLLALHERDGRKMPLVWDVAHGRVDALALDLPGEVSAQWYADGRALLIQHSAGARSDLHRYDLVTGQLTPLHSPTGSITAAAARPDGTVEFAWSSAGEPSRLRRLTGPDVMTPPGPPAPTSVPVEDVWADGPGGRVHALLARPAATRPYPAVFLVHGGPTAHDADAFHAERAAWVDHGFAVVQVNYRGSTGYGSAWEDALKGRPGLTELEDVAAVRDHLLAAGELDGERLVLAGGSWGGYLTLLGLGVQPEVWALGLAAVPVADYVTAYADEMEPLRAMDRVFFGGSPQEVPDRYRTSSPISYVDRVRAPVLVLVGENDPRCPARQVDTYLAALQTAAARHEVYRFDAGHGTLVIEERVRLMRAELDFVARHLR